MTAPQGSPPRPPSFWRTVKAVAWSFIGLRKDSEYREDLARLQPLHIIAVGLVAGVLLVLGLIVLVKWVVAK